MKSWSFQAPFPWLCLTSVIGFHLCRFAILIFTGLYCAFSNRLSKSEGMMPLGAIFWLRCLVKCHPVKKAFLLPSYLSTISSSTPDLRLSSIMNTIRTHFLLWIPGVELPQDRSESMADRMPYMSQGKEVGVCGK